MWKICSWAGLGPNRFILIREFRFAEVSQKSKNNFDSLGVSKSFFIFDSLERITLFFSLIHFDSVSKRTNRIDSFWFTLILLIDSIYFTILLDFYSFWFVFILICDSIWFYSCWFGLILIRYESRFTRESWFTFQSWFTC